MSLKDGILDVTIKKYWFNRIKSGEKIHEYRNVTSWKNKLSEASNYKIIRFRSGLLTKSNNKEKVLLGNIKSITIRNGKDTDLKCNNDVYDIEFELIKPEDIYGKS